MTNITNIFDEEFEEDDDEEEHYLNDFLGVVAFIQNSIQNNIIDYLHIDAQGCDFDVLKSLGQYISNVKEGVLETAYTYDKTIYVEQIENTLEFFFLSVSPHFGEF